MMRISERYTCIHHMNFYWCLLAAISFCESTYIRPHSLADFTKLCVDIVDISQIILKNSAAPIRVAATTTLRNHDAGFYVGESVNKSQVEAKQL
jgi:hypothetical protein